MIFHPLSLPAMLSPVWNALLSNSPGSLPGIGSTVHSFVILLLLLLLAAVPFFSIGVLAGWFQWRFLAQRTIHTLERQNACLRKRLQDPDYAAERTA